MEQHLVVDSVGHFSSQLDNKPCALVGKVSSSGRFSISLCPKNKQNKTHKMMMMLRNNNCQILPTSIILGIIKKDKTVVSYEEIYSVKWILTM